MHTRRAAEAEVRCPFVLALAEGGPTGVWRGWGTDRRFPPASCVRVVARHARSDAARSGR
jgi:hypothetical protein